MPRFLAILARVVPLIVKHGLGTTLYGIYQLTDFKRAFFFKAYSYLFFNRVPGDYLEFGVFQGRSFILSHRMSVTIPSLYNAILPLQQPDWQSRSFKGMRFFAFDSFEGMPAGDHDRTLPEHREGMLKCSVEEFKRALKRSKIPEGDIEIVKGYFNTSLTDQLKRDRKLRAAALIYIDCDTYESTVTTLNFCTDLIGSSAMIAFDDWYIYGGSDASGEPRAFAEWRRANPQFDAVEYCDIGWHGKSFIVFTSPIFPIINMAFFIYSCSHSTL